MNVILALICGLIIGAMLGYHFAMDALLRFQGKQGVLDPAVRNAVRAMKNKPQEVKFYPGMSDEEADKEDGELQATLRTKIHKSAKELEDEV